MNTLVIILLFFWILALIAFIVVSIVLIKDYINVKPEWPIYYFIKDLDGNNLIHVDDIEQVTKRWSAENKQYEIVFYLKSGHEIKEAFNNSEACNMRFEDIKLILNNSYY